MKARTARTVLLRAAVLAFSVYLTGQAQEANRNFRSLALLSESLRDLSSRISPSVVQVVGTGYGFEANDRRGAASVLYRQRSAGSGLIVSDDGYIMTNAHVIDGARTIRVKLNKAGTETSFFEATLVGMDSALDLALLKIHATGLQALPFGNSLDVKQGEMVLAFGSPLGMDDSVSLGIVSAPSRQLSEEDPRVYIQTDAPINPGNSGGPLVDIEGRVIGMNTFILSQSGGSDGLGFAIPSNVIRYVYASLMKEGHVHRGQIGILARTITEPLAVALNLEPGVGVLVEDVWPWGPADQAGVDVGDVILSFGGAPLHNIRDLYLLLFQYSLGDFVELQLMRDRKKLSVTVAVTESMNDPKRFADFVSPEKNSIARIGIIGLTVDATIRQSFPLRYVDGILVVGRSGLTLYIGDHPREGDVIHTVNGQYVRNIEELRTELDKLKPKQPLVLHVERNGALMFLVLEAD